MGKGHGRGWSGIRASGLLHVPLTLCLLSFSAGLTGRAAGGDHSRDGVERGLPSHQGQSTVPARCASSAEYGATEAIALLRRGYRAERVAVYSGVKVIRAPDRCRNSAVGRSSLQSAGPRHICSDYERAVRIWHGGPSLTRLEFVAQDENRSPATAGGGAAPGAPVVVENGRRRWFYSPRHRTWRPISWRPPEPRLELLLKNYRIVPGAVDRVAGRLALQIRIVPRYPGNPRKQTWLDLATGIALRSDLYDHRGNLVSTAGFRHFRTETCLPPALFQAPGAAGPASSEAASPPRLSFEVMLPRYVPRGYVLDRISRSREGGTEVARARFTDGLNVLSLVQWKGRRDPEERDSQRFWAPGERVRRSIGPLSVLLAGDLGGVELRRISASLRPPQRGLAAVIAHK
jgi:outer membrane lipoprotein-sorting protein